MLAGPVSAQLKPSDAQEIAAAVTDCISATKPSGVDGKVLSAAGWSLGNFTSPNGQTIQSKLRVFGKSGSGALIMTDENEKAAGQICIVTAGLSKAQDYQQVVNAIDAIENVSAAQQDKLKIVFSNGKQVLQSDRTGSKAKPAVQIAVMAIAPEKK
jgi:hypothetical protein